MALPPSSATGPNLLWQLNRLIYQQPQDDGAIKSLIDANKSADEAAQSSLFYAAAGLSKDGHYWNVGSKCLQSQNLTYMVNQFAQLSLHTIGMAFQYAVRTDDFHAEVAKGIAEASCFPKIHSYYIRWAAMNAHPSIQPQITASPQNKIVLRDLQNPFADDLVRAAALGNVKEFKQLIQDPSFSLLPLEPLGDLLYSTLVSQSLVDISPHVPYRVEQVRQMLEAFLATERAKQIAQSDFELAYRYATQSRHPTQPNGLAPIAALLLPYVEPKS